MQMLIVDVMRRNCIVKHEFQLTLITSLGLAVLSSDEASFGP